MGMVGWELMVEWVTADMADMVWYGHGHGHGDERRYALWNVQLDAHGNPVPTLTQSLEATTQNTFRPLAALRKCLNPLSW